MTWEPPALGTATGYVLQNHSIQPEHEHCLQCRPHLHGPRYAQRAPAPGLLVSGNDYVVRLSAQHMPGVRTERGWFTLVVPSATATTGSALLTVP